MVVDWAPICFGHEVDTAIGFGRHHFSGLWAPRRYFGGDLLRCEAVDNVIYLSHSFVILYHHRVKSTLVRYKHFHIVFIMPSKGLGGRLTILTYFKIVEEKEETNL